MRLMKAVYITSFAPVGEVANYIKFGDVAEPPVWRPLSNTEVVVQTKAAGMSVEDLFVAQKSHAGGMFFLQISQPSIKNPAILGCDFAGIVKEVGEGVSDLLVGDAVCGLNDAPNKGQQGVWCEQVLTTRDRLVQFDSSVLSFQKAAALVIPAFVATSMFKQAQIHQRVQSNENDDTTMKCLVVGASGPIGSALTSLLCCESNSVEVTGVCSTANVEKVRRLGVGRVLDYTCGSITSQLDQDESFDCVFDLVGGRDLQDETLPLLNDGGSFVTAVGPIKDIGSRILTLSEQNFFFYHLFLWMPFFNLFSGRKYAFVDPPDFTRDLFEPIVNAHVEPQIERVVQFKEEAIREAIKELQKNRSKGRLILDIDST